MAATTELERMIVRLIGDATEYRRMLNESQAATNRFARSVEFRVRQVGQSLTRIGRSLSLRLTAPILAAGVAIYKVGSDFEAEMSKIVGLVGIASGQVERWSSDLLEMGPRLAASPRALAQALFFVTSAGYRGVEALDVLTLSAKASAGGMGEIKSIADAVTSAVNAYGKENLSAAKATDVLVAAVREGKLEAEALAPVMGRLIPMASAMKVRFEDVAGALAAMSRTGSSAHEGAVQVQAILTTMGQEADKAKKLLAGTDITFADLRDTLRKPGGIIEVLRTLDTTFKDNDTALQQIFPNVRAFRGVMNLLAQNAKAVDSVMKGVAESTGSVNRAFLEAQKTAAFKFKQAMASIQATLIELSHTVIPMVNEVLATLGDIVKKVAGYWGELNPITKDAIVRLAAYAALAGPLIMTLGGLTLAIGGVTTAFVVLKPLVLAVGAGLLGLVGLPALIFAPAVIKLIVDYTQEVHNLNVELQRATTLHAAMGRQLDREHQGFMAQTSAIADAGEKVKVYGARMAQVDRDVQQHTENLKKYKQQVEETGGTMGKVLEWTGIKDFFVTVAPPDYDMAIQKVAETTASLKRSKAELNDLRTAYTQAAEEAKNMAVQHDSVAKQMGQTVRSAIQGIMGPVGQFMAEFQQQHQTMLESMRTGAESIIEQFMDPLERFTRRKAELDRYLEWGMFGRGARAQGIYNRALKEAREQLDGFKDKTVDIRFRIDGRDAAQAGSLEALARLDEYMERIRGVETVGVRPQRVRPPAPSPIPITAPIGPQVWGAVTGAGGKVEAYLKQMAGDIKEVRRQGRVRKALDVRPSALGGTITPGGAP